MRVDKIVIAAGALLFAQLCVAGIITNTPTADTWLYEGSGNNFGTSAYFSCSDNTGVLRRSLLYFDLSAYAGQTVQDDATLTLYTQGISAQTKGDPVSIYLINAANAGWTEGGADWTTKDDSVAWSHAGLGAPGDGYGSTPLLTVPIPASSNGPRPFTIAKSVLQSWIDSPGSNAGILVRLTTEVEPGGDDTVSWHSKEQAGLYVPTLSFTIAIPEPATMGMLGVGALTVMMLRRRLR